MSKINKADSVIGYTASAHLHLVGSSQCVVDGLKQVIEYTNERIRIDVGSFCVNIIGSGLCINEFSPQGAIIDGDILSLALSNE